MCGSGLAIVQEEKMAFDFKKEYKSLYAPTRKPSIVDVPDMTFIMVDGKGDPNTSAEYKAALEVLYGLSPKFRTVYEHTSK
jgi:hypothetical protein